LKSSIEVASHKNKSFLFVRKSQEKEEDHFFHFKRSGLIKILSRLSCVEEKKKRFSLEKIFSLAKIKSGK